MKKQYLLCSVLLLSAPYVQYTCAMQGWYNAPVQQAAHSEQCTLCHQNMPYGYMYNPRVRLACGHRFHHRCVTHWAYGRGHVSSYCPTCYRSIQFVPDYPDQILHPAQPVQPAPAAQVVSQAQPVRAPQQAQAANQAQPAEQTEQEQCAICYEDMTYGNAQDPRARLRCGHKFHQRCLTSWRNASYNPTCPMCRGPFQPIQDYPDPIAQPVQQAPAIQVPNQVQPAPVAQVEQEQVQQLTDRQLQILEAFKQDLSNSDNNIQVMLIDANTDPLALANIDFINALTNDEQRALLQEFIAITFDAQEAQQPAPARNVQAAQPALTQVEHDLVVQLARELAPLERDDVDNVLFEAYTNPSVLVQSSALLQVLNDQQKQLIDDLLMLYTQRISQQ